jgi:hypothetical protein
LAYDKSEAEFIASDFLLGGFPTQEPTLTNRGWGTQGLRAMIVKLFEE